MQPDSNMEFFSHVTSAEFDILVALLTKDKNGTDKDCALVKERDYQCYAPDHHQYWALIARESLAQTAMASYENLLDAMCAKFAVSGSGIEEKEHGFLWQLMEIATKTYSREDFVRFAIELRLQPAEYSLYGIKQALMAKYAEKEILPMYKIALCVNALALGYFTENPCKASAPFVSSLSELRSVGYFTQFALFRTDEINGFSEQEQFNLAVLLAIIALRQKDQVFYGRSGDSKAELIRKLKRFTALLTIVPGFAYSSGQPEIMENIYAFNAVYLGKYKMPLPKEMASEMLFARSFAELSESEQELVLKAEQTNQSLEGISKKLLALGITKDQMQDLIGVLALSNNKLIKIENIFIEWAVKLGLR